MGAPRVDGLLGELQETETRRLERGTVIPEPGTESLSQETRGQDHATDDRGRETGSQGLGTADPGQRTGNPDTGLGRGTSLGPETGIIKNIRRTGASQNRGPGQEKVNTK